MAMRVEEELRNVGCRLEARAFREIVRAVKSELFAELSDEQLLTRSESLVPQFLSEVRRRCGCRALPDYLINGVLSNRRKYTVKA